MSSPQHRDTFWPGGKLAEGVALRDYSTKMRTRVVCKTKLYASLSGDGCGDDDDANKIAFIS